MRAISMLVALLAAGPAIAQPQTTLPEKKSSVTTGCWVITERAAKTTVTHRSPVGHTHTCPRCGTVWDHQAHSGHNCPNCGTTQYIQDPTPRMVTIRSAPTTSSVTETQRVIQSINYGGCPNGNCPYVRVR